MICVVTGAREPVILGNWVQSGAHVNLVGAHTPSAREADSSLVVRGRIYVDSLKSAFEEAGDIIIPIKEGVIDRAHVVGELGGVLLGSVEGRRGHADVTIYKSLGLVIQDLMAAHAAIERRELEGGSG